MINLDQYFDINPLGIALCPYVELPKERDELDALFNELFDSLGKDNTTIKLKVGDACNLYERFYRKEAYELAAVKVGLSAATIETHYAYTARHVPIGARVSGLRISHLRAVAHIDDPTLQRDYLLACKEMGWTVGKFEDWLKGLGVDVPEYHSQTDRQAEDDRQYLGLVGENTTLKRELAEYREKVAKTQEMESTQPTEDDFLLFEHGQIDTFANAAKKLGYRGITIYANREVRWIP